MYEGFTSAVAEQLPEVRHVVDRFHVAKLLGESGGFVEGLNNRIKAAKRRCYGLGSAKALYQRLKLDLEGYELFGEALPNM